jgi:flagellar basal body-associated protein FliL
MEQEQNDNNAVHTEQKKSSNKLIYFFIGIVILILLGIIYMMWQTHQNTVHNDQIEARQDSIATANALDSAVILGKKSGYNAAEAKFNDSLKTYQDSLNSLQVQLTQCQQAKKTKTAGHSLKKSKAVSETKKAVNTKTDQFAPPAAPKSSQASSNQYQTSLPAANKYVGLTDGDFWISITNDGHLYYAFKKSAIGDVAPGQSFQLNSTAGPKFVLSNDGTTYVCVTNTVVSDNLLKKTFHWNVYCGNDKGYPAWFPHELVKPAIAEVKGTEAGEITNDDLKEIGKIVPGVAAGTITPNGVYVTAADGQKYGGWEFVSTILYKSK